MIYNVVFKIVFYKFGWFIYIFSSNFIYIDYFLFLFYYLLIFYFCKFLLKNIIDEMICLNFDFLIILKNFKIEFKSVKLMCKLKYFVVFELDNVLCKIVGFILSLKFLKMIFKVD